MNTVTISPKYQIVIPSVIRKNMHLLPGQKVQVVQFGNRIELVPLKNIKKMRGFLKGINTDVNRSEDRV